MISPLFFMKVMAFTAETDETYFEAWRIAEGKCCHRWVSYDDHKRFSQFKSDYGEAGAVTHVTFTQEGYETIYFTLRFFSQHSHPRLHRVLHRTYDDPAKLRKYLRDRIQWTHRQAAYMVTQHTDRSSQHLISVGNTIAGLLGAGE